MAETDGDTFAATRRPSAPPPALIAVYFYSRDEEKHIMHLSQSKVATAQGQTTTFSRLESPVITKSKMRILICYNYL